MFEFIKRLRKKVLLKELKSWDEIMKENIEKIAEIDVLINDKTLTKVEVSRLKQLKKSYEDAYNQANIESGNIRKELEKLS